ncbi:MULTISPECIES: YceI family protein [unclassified Actinotalea]|uniref:YceI family protein n=1 Tax=unclassified Actinotalea TaxID=2638618 RepID=UPI0015F77CA2|nr:MULTISPECIES: YceI family protein [unclassified Actinotalea]
MSEGPAAPELSPEHLRRRLVVTLAVVVLAVALVVGGPWVYARFLAPDARAPLTLSTPTAAPTAQAQVLAGPVDVDGAWRIGEGSAVGYRLAEVLTGEPVTVVGRTEDVTGSAEVTDGALTAVDVVVSTATIVTDESARDAYFRRALDTTAYPEATFTLTAPVDVSAIGATTEPVAVAVDGTLSFHGVSRPVVASFQVQRTEAGIEVAGQVPVTLEDFGLEAPDLGFVTVEPAGAVEILLVLVR